MEPTFWQSVLPILVVLAILGTGAVMVYGVVQMVGAGKEAALGDPAAEMARAKRSNQLMQYRIVLQAIAIGLFLLMLSMRG